MLRPSLRAEETAARQVEAMGLRRHDVRHIVMTHLDFDHAGGVEDFPNAIVHVHADEFDAAQRREGLVARGRYRPEQWDERIQWRLHRPEGARWYGLDAMRPLGAREPELVMVPLPGHSAGHCGVAVRDGRRWLLLAGDAYFARSEADPVARCPLSLRAYQWLLAVDRGARRATQRWLRELAFAHADEVTVCSSHDAQEFDALVAGDDLAREAPRAGALAHVLG